MMHMSYVIYYKIMSGLKYSSVMDPNNNNKTDYLLSFNEWNYFITKDFMFFFTINRRGHKYILTSRNFKFLFSKPK